MQASSPTCHLRRPFRHTATRVAGANELTKFSLFDNYYLAMLCLIAWPTPSIVSRGKALACHMHGVDKGMWNKVGRMTRGYTYAGPTSNVSGGEVLCSRLHHQPSGQHSWQWLGGQVDMWVETTEAQAPPSLTASPRFHTKLLSLHSSIRSTSVMVHVHRP